MSETNIKRKTRVRPKLERPRLHKVILVNDDFTPREFVVSVLKAEFRMNEDQAHRVMMTAHRRGVCVVAVFAQDIAETKATRATEAGRKKGYPLLFTTEPEEYRRSHRDKALQPTKAGEEKDRPIERSLEAVDPSVRERNP